MITNDVISKKRLLKLEYLHSNEFAKILSRREVQSRNDTTSLMAIKIIQIKSTVKAFRR
jgi:hypothetical protein